jgi:transcriptional regulator with XRE-family HTH domain
MGGNKGGVIYVVTDVESNQIMRKGGRMPILRNELGDVLRGARLTQGKTLRDVSSDARVSLGYLSEVERGQKEASSELLASICEALDVPMSALLRDVADRFGVAEALAAAVVPTIPDTVPEFLGSSRRPGVGLLAVRR